RVADEVPRLINLGAAVRPVLRVIAVVAGVDDKDLVALDPQPRLLLPALEVLGAVEVVVAAAHPLQVDEGGGADEPLEGEVADELATAEEMGRRVEVGGDMEGGRDLLSARLVEGKPLHPLDARAGVAGEGGCVHREVLRQVEHLHGATKGRTRAAGTNSRRGRWRLLVGSQIERDRRAAG